MKIGETFELAGKTYRAEAISDDLDLCAGCAFLDAPGCSDAPACSGPKFVEHKPPASDHKPPAADHMTAARALRDALDTRFVGVPPELGAPYGDQKASNPKDSIGDTKVPLWLLSPIAKAHWALGQFAGMCKYGAWNWRVAGVRTSVYLSAMDRHLSAYLSGERLDPVDGTHHLGNVMACAAILLDAEAAGKLTDDRPPSVDLRPAFNEVQATMAALRIKYAHLTPKHHTIGDTQ